MANQPNKADKGQPKDDPRQAVESGEPEITGNVATPPQTAPGSGKSDPDATQGKIGEDRESGRHDAR